MKNCAAFPQKELSWKKKNNKEIHFACQDYCSKNKREDWGKGKNNYVNNDYFKQVIYQKEYKIAVKISYQTVKEVRT